MGEVMASDEEEQHSRCGVSGAAFGIEVGL